MMQACGGIESLTLDECRAIDGGTGINDQLKAMAKNPLVAAFYAGYQFGHDILGPALFG